MTVKEILEEKNEQRRQANGAFLWGIGNSVGNGSGSSRDQVGEPEVLFSPQRRDPGRKDEYRLAWTAATDAVTGEAYEFPPGPLVTSGSKTEHPIQPRYALVCWSESAIEFDTNGARFDFFSLRPLIDRGANQVAWQEMTTVVRRVDAPPSGNEFPVAFRARLVPPYVVRLHEPKVVERPTAGPVTRGREPRPLRVRVIDHTTIPPRETTIEASQVDVRPQGVFVSDLKLRERFYSRDDSRVVIE